MHDRLNVSAEQEPKFTIAGKVVDKILLLPCLPNTLAPGVRLIVITINDGLSLGSWQIKDAKILTADGQEPDPAFCEPIWPILTAINQRLRDNSQDTEEFLNVNSNP